jgi:hypothetical protein
MIPLPTPEAAEVYAARVARLTTAMSLQGELDRVPVPLAVVDHYPAHRAGLTPYDAMYDFDRVAGAFIDFNRDEGVRGVLEHSAVRRRPLRGRREWSTGRQIDQDRAKLCARTPSAEMPRRPRQ